jgi:hypothetical protein
MNSEWISVDRRRPAPEAVVSIARINGGGFYALGRARYVRGRWVSATDDTPIPDDSQPTHWRLR